MRFKSSAAHAASNEKQLHGLLDHKVGIIQAVADNFDANISSPNGIKATHALALLLTQMQANKPDDMNLETARPPTTTLLNKNDMKEEIVQQVQVSHYNGPKMPDMPERFATHAVLPLKILAPQCITLPRARQLDHEFLQRITYDPTTPEYNGFNTQMSREFGQSVKPATTSVYIPLIDMVPSDPDTIMTAMMESQRMTQVWTNHYGLHK